MVLKIGQAVRGAEQFRSAGLSVKLLPHVSGPVRAVLKVEAALLTAGVQC